MGTVKPIRAPTSFTQYFPSMPYFSAFQICEHKSAALDVAISSPQPGHVTVKTAELKNNLSKYLRRVREKGVTITVCDRDTPIATISPVKTEGDPEWEEHKTTLREIEKKTGLKITVREKRPRKVKTGPPTPAVDGRTDLETVVEMRRTRDW